MSDTVSDIAYCRKCDRIKHVDEDCNYLGCNPELEQREVPAGELYEELREMHDRLAAAEQRATESEAILATIGGADKATLARKLRRANAAAREGEQRAKESAAFVRECAEAMIAGSNKIILLVDALDIFGDGDDPLVQAALHKQEVVQGRLLTLGLRARDTAPATQPDERAGGDVSEPTNAAPA